MWWAKLRSLGTGLARRDRLEDDLADEIGFHIEARIQDLVNRGVDPARAARQARIEFGSVERYKDEVRGARGLRLIDELRADLMCGFRGLWRAPGFTLVASLSLALGIGANTLVFSLLDATLLRPLALPEPQRLVTIWNVPDRSQPRQLGTSSISRYVAFRDLTHSFESVAAYNGIACGVKSLGFEENGLPPERIQGQTVSPSMFHTLGVRPLMGRLFTEDEDRVDAVAPVVILSYRMWQRRYGSDPVIVGKTLVLDRAPTTVIGVMPEDFDFFGDEVEFLLPLCLTRVQAESRVGGNTIIARLQPGVSIDEAQAELDTLGAQLSINDPQRHEGFGAYVESVQRARARITGPGGQPSGDYGSALLMLQGAVAFVLLIACANVAGLLLARTTSRRTEVAVRQALGGSRRRIIRQLVTETLPLAALGAMLGVLLARGGLALFVATAPPSFPHLEHLSIDFRILAFTALVVLVTAIVFAIVPAVQASSIKFAGTLTEVSRSATGGAERQRARSVLVTGQIALALVLLIGAGLMLQSFVRVIKNDLGADPANLLTFEFRLPPREVYKQLGMYRGTGLFEVSPVPAETVERVLDRLQTVPGLISVAAANAPPLAGGSFTMPFRIEGRPDPPSAVSIAGVPSLPTAEYIAVTRGFFDVMTIHLRSGRDFDHHDQASSPFVVVINETMARQFFAGEEPIGQRLQFDFLPDERPREIVGVVGDSLRGPFQADRVPTVYVPHLQQTSRFVGPTVYTRIGMYFVMRTLGEPMSLLPAVKRAVAEVDPATPVAGARTVEETLDAQVRHLRLYMLLLGIFGGVSTLLAAAGIYGVMAYSISQRTREIAIRMALGARMDDILRLVLRQASVFIVGGLSLGVIGALTLRRVIETSLFQVTATDPLTYVAVSGLLLIIATIACIVPARRATIVNPTVALKHE